MKVLAFISEILGHRLRHSGPKVLRIGAWSTCAAGLAMAPVLSPAAPSCSFSSVNSVGFGNYNTLSTTANTNGIGQLVIVCTGGGGPTFEVTLSTGQSNSYASRIMNSGSNQLNYNLYTNSSLTTIWGDGTGGSSIMTASPNSTTTLSVYGQIPAEQNVPAGSYSDSITATVTF